MRHITFLIFLACTGCLAVDPTDLQSTRARELINFCIRELQHKGGSLSADIDRVYVLAAGKRFELMFTVGEFGTFGERSEGFRIGLTCGVTDESPINLDYMSEPLIRTYVESTVASIMRTEALKIESLDMLYLRQGDEFNFSGAQRNNRDKVYEHLRDEARQRQEARKGEVQIQ